MLYEEIKARKAEILAEMEGEVTEERLAELNAESEALEAEARSIVERAEKLDAEERKALEENETKKLEEVELPEERTIEMTDIEIRSTREYAEAFLNGLKTDNYDEARALLSTNGTNAGASLTGYVPVPTQLEKEIQTAWEKNELVNLCKKSYFKGNLAVGFELSADGASVHVEGTNAPSEEVVTLGVVEIKAQNIKKWITVSDEALEGTTVDTMGYLVKEIAYQIVKKAENLLVTKISNAPTSADSDEVGVPAINVSSITGTTVATGSAELSGEARNLTLVINRGTRVDFLAAQQGLNYLTDVFDGAKVVYTDQLDSFADASSDEVFAILGDFSLGAQFNFPNGEGITMKVDDASLAEKDLVKIVGRQYVGIGLVADKAFVKFVKAGSSI